MPLTLILIWWIIHNIWNADCSDLKASLLYQYVKVKARWLTILLDISLPFICFIFLHGLNFCIVRWIGRASELPVYSLSKVLFFLWPFISDIESNSHLSLTSDQETCVVSCQAGDYWFSYPGKPVRWIDCRDMTKYKSWIQRKTANFSREKTGQVCLVSVYG